MRLHIALLILLAFAPSCAKNATTATSERQEPQLSAEEIRVIAEEAYIYAFPMMETYRTMYVQAINRYARGYKAPFNELSHETALLGPSFEDIVRPNNDTIYSFTWLDLRAQPVVITVPEVENRYYSIQLVDLFTHNFAYVGTRTTGSDAGSYVIAGPGWRGTKPPSAKALFQSETELVYCIIRTEVRGRDDLEAVRRIQEGFRLTPLHLFSGRSRAPTASGITFPSYDAEKAASAGFIDLLNFLLSRVAAPSEEALMARFSKIGVRAGAVSASMIMDAATADAINAGVRDAIDTIDDVVENPGALEGVRARQAGGWFGVDGLFGDAETMRGNYLARAAGAKIGLYGNDTVEAYYPAASADGSGRPLDGSTGAYVLRFEKDEIPPVDAFWSITMYGMPEQLMIENPIGRYSIGDRSNLKYGTDGSLTIYIQHRSPGKNRERNWLPAPEGPFSLQLRMYLPAPEALDPLYLPPPVRGGS